MIPLSLHQSIISFLEYVANDVDPDDLWKAKAVASDLLSDIKAKRERFFNATSKQSD